MGVDNARRQQGVLAVMSKAPVPGRVKTRLTPPYSPRRAARLYRQLLRQTLRTVAGVDALELQLWCAPDTAHGEFRRLSRLYGCRRRRQPAGNLGRRMATILSSNLRRQRPVILVGADCPVMSAEIVQQSLSALAQGADLVLGATEDGGYALIGMNRSCGRLFQRVPWSTSRVLAVTLVRARQAGLSVQVLDGLWDVDTPQDVRRWKRLLSQPGL